MAYSLVDRSSGSFSGPEQDRGDEAGREMAGCDWEDLRIFGVVAETGSFTAAGAALGLSQPTVVRRLTTLERDLGLTLVERTGNRIALTPAGDALRSALGGMHFAADRALRAAADAAGRSRLVGITATGSIALFLADRLDRLTAASGVAVEIRGTRERLNLARREAEVAIRMRRLPPTGELVARRLATVAFTIYGPAGGDGGRVVAMAEPERRPSQAAFLEDWAADRAVVARVDDVALRHRAAVGLGAATLLPCFLGDADSALVRLVEPPQALAEDAYLMVHEDLKRAPAIAAVASAVAALFKAEAGALAGHRGPAGAATV